MAKFKYNAPKSKVGSVSIVSCSLLLVGIVLIVIGYNVEISSWIKTFGLAFLVCAIPLVIWVIFKIINKKIKEM